MPFYSVGGTTLESNVPIPELQATGADRRGEHFVFHLLPETGMDDSAGGWYHEWVPPETTEPWLKMARQEGGYLLRFPRHADFRVSVEERRITCAPLPGVPGDTVRHLLLDQVMPLLLSSGRRLTLHASGVAGAQGAFAFMAATGHGKSTLAAGFCRRGYQLITDDCLLLDLAQTPPLVVPTYPGVRLWDDMAQTFAPEASLEAVAHYTSKKRLAFDDAQFCSAPVPLRRIYAIREYDESAPPERIEITAVNERESFLQLARYAYQLDIDLPDRLRQNFAKFSALAGQGLVRTLSFPYETSALESVLDAIARDLASASPVPA